MTCWLEESPLEFDTPMGPAWAAAKYLAVCCWPDNQSKRTLLVRALLRVAAEAAGYRYPWPERRERVVQRIDKATQRLNKHGFVAAEIARLKCLPTGFKFPVMFHDPERYHIGKYTAGTLEVTWPNSRAVGRGGRVSLKKLQLLAGGPDWKKRTWKPFLPAVPYIIALQDQFPPGVNADGTVRDIEVPDLVTMCRDTGWLEPALICAERWACRDLPDGGIATKDLIRLFRTP